jgi:hypothetical protein
MVNEKSKAIAPFQKVMDKIRCRENGLNLRGLGSLKHFLPLPSWRWKDERTFLPFGDENMSGLERPEKRWFPLMPSRPNCLDWLLGRISSESLSKRENNSRCHIHPCLPRTSAFPNGNNKKRLTNYPITNVRDIYSPKIWGGLPVTAWAKSA